MNEQQEIRIKKEISSAFEQISGEIMQKRQQGMQDTEDELLVSKHDMVNAMFDRLLPYFKKDL